MDNPARLNRSPTRQSRILGQKKCQILEKRCDKGVKIEAPKADLDFGHSDFSSGWLYGITVAIRFLCTFTRSQFKRGEVGLL